MASKTIVFVHGMYMTPLCWEQWVDRFQSKGYHCLAPAWPGRDQPIEVLRQRHPDPQLGQAKKGCKLKSPSTIRQISLPEVPNLREVAGRTIMAEDLWKIRERKKMSVAQLALRSGLSQDLLDDYEAGKPLTSAHRLKLAKILYVNDHDIKIQSAPRPQREKPAPPPDQPQPVKPVHEQPARPAPPARQGQIDFLKGLAQHLGLQPQQMEDEIGKPLNALTAPEATQWIRTFQVRVPPGSTTPDEAKPAGYRSKRAHLPEGVDLFEGNYLLEAQQSKAALTVKLFNGEVIDGAVIGFGPYTLTLETGGGREVTLSKLAIAYYRRQRSAA